MAELTKAEVNKKWAFRMFIYVTIINIMVFILSATQVVSPLPEQNILFARNMMIFGLMESVCLTIGIFMLILYFRKNKFQGGRIAIATVGLGLFTIFKLFSIFLG